MSSSEGLRIISVAKALGAYQSDPMIAGYFGATRMAGRVGLFLSALRCQTKMEWGKFVVLAANSLIDLPTLNMTIRPWLERNGFIEVHGTAEHDAVVCNVVDYDAVLRSTSEFFHGYMPTLEEKLVLDILDHGIQAPTTTSDLQSKLSSNPEQAVGRALELAKSYSVIRVAQSGDMKEPVLYSPLIWGDNIGKAAKALSHLDANRRALLMQLIDAIRKYQGVPEPSAKRWAVKNGDAQLVEFAVGLGLLERTEICNNAGTTTTFLNTPHLYGELAATHGKDVCDRVRLFLDSIRHGQHYGEWYTGRINDPVALLGKLIDTGEIGPCTAIGRDYVLVEKAGVVRVKPSSRRNQYVMELIQRDTVELIRDILENRERPPDMNAQPTDGRPGQDRFMSAEQTRAKLGKLPEPVRQAEAEMVRKLREMV